MTSKKWSLLAGSRYSEVDVSSRLTVMYFFTANDVKLLQIMCTYDFPWHFWFFFIYFHFPGKTTSIGNFRQPFRRCWNCKELIRNHRFGFAFTFFLEKVLQNIVFFMEIEVLDLEVWNKQTETDFNQTCFCLDFCGISIERALKMMSSVFFRNPP